MSNITVEEIAKVAHEVNRAYCGFLDDPSQLPWEDAPEWQRTSCIAGAQAHLADPSLTPEGSHECWAKMKREEGWIWGSIKDPEAKTHPCLVPYEELPSEQRLKDYLFSAVVRSLDPTVDRQGGEVPPKTRDELRTKGGYRVGIDFNPSGDDTVEKIKRMAANLINLIEDIPLPIGNLGNVHPSEVARLKALAQTGIESGAMWAVKAVTKRPQ